MGKVRWVDSNRKELALSNFSACKRTRARINIHAHTYTHAHQALKYALAEISSITQHWWYSIFHLRITQVLFAQHSDRSHCTIFRPDTGRNANPYETEKLRRLYKKCHRDELPNVIQPVWDRVYNDDADDKRLSDVSIITNPLVCWEHIQEANKHLPESKRDQFKVTKVTATKSGSQGRHRQRHRLVGAAPLGRATSDRACTDNSEETVRIIGMKVNMELIEQLQKIARQQAMLPDQLSHHAVGSSEPTPDLKWHIHKGLEGTGSGVESGFGRDGTMKTKEEVVGVGEKEFAKLLTRSDKSEMDAFCSRATL